MCLGCLGIYVWTLFVSQDTCLCTAFPFVLLDVMLVCIISLMTVLSPVPSLPLLLVVVCALTLRLSRLFLTDTIVHQQPLVSLSLPQQLSFFSPLLVCFVAGQPAHPDWFRNSHRSMEEKIQTNNACQHCSSKCGRRNSMSVESAQNVPSKF